MTVHGFASDYDGAWHGSASAIESVTVAASRTPRATRHEVGVGRYLGRTKHCYCFFVLGNPKRGPGTARLATRSLIGGKLYGMVGGIVW